ncbi:VWA domain-containing protein [Rhodobacteraceae bacterium KMM 6894]|nr:VWA domain-containing protein [Rhodobacteraceae bacterium KMM 6894]
MRFLLSFILLMCTANASAAQTNTRDVMVVFDMSGSMWGQVDGIAKVEIARDAFGGLLNDWQANGTRTGLIAYGHRERGNCADIETLALPGDGTDIAGVIAGLSPIGKTPLSDAVRQAAEHLRFTEEAATVVLLSDGVETCNADPCAIGAELEALGLDFTAHVIGFDIAEGDKAQLQCLANATGGQYFDAADAGELANAMRGVAQATVEPALIEQTPQTEEIHPVIIRLSMPYGVDLPVETTIFLNGDEIGRVSDAQAVVPGLSVDLPIGQVELRAEAEKASGTFSFDITAQTEILELELTPVQNDYIIQVGPLLPLTGEHIVLIENTTGLDRDIHSRVYLAPAGSSDQAEYLGGNLLSPIAGIYNESRIPSPARAGTYDIVVMDARQIEEYARFPVQFADAVVPEWLGVDDAEIDATVDARWAGDAGRQSSFRFFQDGRAVAPPTVMSNVATEDGFKLTVPDTEGVYDLVLRWYDADRNRIDSDMGQIAVGMVQPVPDVTPEAAQDEAPNEEATLEETSSGDLSNGDSDTDGLAQEAAAMGAEEFPTIAVGDLHGNWLLVAADYRFHPMLATQVVHEIGAVDVNGDIDVRAHDWNFGETTGSESFVLTREGDNITFVANLSDQTYAGTLTREGTFWRGEMEYDGNTVDSLDVILVRPDEIPLLYVAANPAPVAISIIAHDERGEAIETPTQWSIIQGDAQDGAHVRSDSGQHYQEAITPDAYFVTATSDGMSGTANFVHAEGWRTGHVVVVRPQDEGADLPIETAFYCSPDENCTMKMADIPISFDLPEGWGAERPLRMPAGEATFNMATLTPDGPFYATLNQPQRMASLGPCTELMTGTFCHDATDNPALLADIAVIQRSLSFKPVGMWLDDDRFDTLLSQLTGETK